MPRYFYFEDVSICEPTKDCSIAVSRARREGRIYRMVEKYMAERAATKAAQEKP